GEIASIAVTDGQDVAKGARIAQIRQAVEGKETYSYDSEGNQIVNPGRTTYRTHWVTAPVDGTVHLTAVLNQNVNAGDSIGNVPPKTHSVVAQLTADQMYRLTTSPETARVSVKNGPQPFDCTGLKITTNSGSAGEDGVTATNIEARCPIPADVRVFPGQTATLTINAGEVKDVLTVPATAVEGRYQKGYVYTPDGKQKEVEIGLTDGNLVEIRSGLEEGEEILEYVPGGETAAMECNPMTGEGC
ncbi:MAG: efflux RND transporter periplasmic adaptor subunit, partial [Actinomycetaceae bacterium]|nr:efflux RND transporter periplasmic adaptor subunit [Actinomycetaceae bacterium]